MPGFTGTVGIHVGSAIMMTIVESCWKSNAPHLLGIIYVHGHPTGSLPG
jgi:hypothetical protein